MIRRDHDPNAVCELFSIEHPIVQAPVWPAATPELAAAVCNAGGLGSVATVYSSVDRVKEHIARVRQLTDRPFAVNHVMTSFDERAFEATLEAKPSVISFSLGDPRDLVSRAHASGAKVIHQVHTVAQAKEAVERGVDAIIAQGSEAGGHGMALGVGTMALVPQVVDAVGRTPVLAAGGIADGRGLAAALLLGAQGVNIGTRFVASREASSSESWRQAILAAQSEDAIRFEVWQSAFPEAPGVYRACPRVLRSPFVEKWSGHSETVNQEPANLRNEILEVVREHRLDKLLQFAGQTAGMIHDVPPAEAIVRGLVSEAEQAIRRSQEFVDGGSVGSRIP